MAKKLRPERLPERTKERDVRDDQEDEQRGENPGVQRKESRQRVVAVVCIAYDQSLHAVSHDGHAGDQVRRDFRAPVSALIPR